MQKFDILDPELNVFESRFLEASAGTGKTFAIEHLVARLTKKIPLEQILAVTFTREAALEMKERIRAKCSAEEMNVFTIHGFCHQSLSEFAFEAATPIQMGGPDTPDHLQEMEQTIEDFFRTGEEEYAEDVTALMRGARYDLGRLKTKIVFAIEKKGPTGDEPLDRVAAACKKRWEIKAKRGDHFSFDDLLIQMEKALAIPAFLEKVRAKYKAVIVDEFQDTDPIQWSIFEKLFLNTHLLYLVGDPKQSIYGFRSADIYTYLRAKKALGEKKLVFLDTNYRSSPQLIDALNDLFTKKPDWIDLPSDPGSLIYHPVNAGRDQNHIEEPPITYFGLQADPGRMRSWPTKALEEEKIFPYIASKILFHEKQFAFSDMVVLIKDRYQAQRLQLFFQKYNIPSSIKRTLHLAQSRGYLAMEILLKAIVHPDNNAHVQAALKGPLLKEGDNPFVALSDLFKEKGFAATYAHFIKHHFNGDPSLFLEVRQTAELLMQEKESELLHKMHHFKQVSPEMDPRLSLRLGDDENEVAIMTTFASKGLEYSIVFALDLASSSSKETQDSEKMRKLYVAFTRAKEKLYIPRFINAAKRFPLSPIENFFQDIDVSIEWIEDISLKPYAPKQETLPTPPSKPHYNYPVETLTSFTSLAKPHAHTLLFEEYKLQDLSTKTLHTLPLGAETGTVIHAIFENYFENPNQTIEQVVCETLTGTHLEGWEEILSDMALNTLHMPLIDNFTLSQLKEGEYFQEMEFLFPQENQWIKGFADLVFKRDDTFYILDWKTNWLGPTDDHYTPERLHKAMNEHDYYLQAKLYSEALHRYVKPLYKNPQFGGAIYVFLRGGKTIGTC
ncbi:MAG: UvrD-helicase domain-containing protein [Simkaniaceae bacterium]|nr:UvrD-helicase domain-containing protein [Candidatus Sacchlamyda saccharinae]